MAVAGVGIEGHVTDDAQGVAILFSDGPHRATGEVLGIAGLRRVIGLPCRFDHGKDRNRWNAQPERLPGGPQDPLDGQALHAGHACHRQSHLVVVHEQRPDEVS